MVIRPIVSTGKIGVSQCAMSKQSIGEDAFLVISLSTSINLNGRSTTQLIPGKDRSESSSRQRIVGIRLGWSRSLQASKTTHRVSQMISENWYPLVGCQLWIPIVFESSSSRGNWHVWRLRHESRSSRVEHMFQHHSSRASYHRI